MKIFGKFLPLLMFTALIISCEGDFRDKAKGEFGNAVVVMDSTQWDSRTADAIRSTYGGSINTLPQPEPKFNLRFRDFSSNEELESLKKNKNIIIAATIDDENDVSRWVRAMLSDEVENSVRQGESFAFPLEDKWYRDQWTMILTSTSDSLLSQKIRNGNQNIVRDLINKELERWEYELFDRGEQFSVERDSLWNKYGWKVRVQHDYTIGVDTTYSTNGDSAHFLTMRRVLPSNDRWFWAWWKDDVKNINHIDSKWINQKRDSLMEQFIQGTREGAYITTEYRRPVNTHSFRLDGDIAYETLGTWRMVNDAMGGPFANITVYDDESRRLFILEYGQFAPRYNKRRFRRQFRAMLRTFKSDSTWNSTKSMASK